MLGSLATKPCVLRKPVEIIAERGLSDESIDAAAAATRFGSGWAWLVKENGELKKT